MMVEVFERQLTEDDEKYGVKFTIGNQSFKLDYYGNREEAEWMKGMLGGALDSLNKEQIPYNVSEWSNVGKERGYWDYFRDLIRIKIEEDLLNEIPLSMKKSRKVISKYFDIDNINK